MGHVARMRESRNICRILVRKPLGRGRRERDGNIKMDLQQMDLKKGWDWLEIVANGGL
jgi:hypothetical protein